MARMVALAVAALSGAAFAADCDFVARTGAKVSERTDSCVMADKKPCPPVREGAGSYMDYNDQRIELRWTQGVVNGAVKVFDKTGVLACTFSVEGGKTQGAMRELFPGRKLKHAVLFKNGEEAGPKLTLTEAGGVVELQCGASSFVPEDRKPCGFEGDGVTQFVFADGRERKYRTTYKAGRLLQDETVDRDGHKLIEMHSDDDHVTAASFHANGKPFRQWSEAKRRFDGDLTEWNEEGVVQTLERYADGKLLARKEYFMNGQGKYEATLDLKSELVTFKKWHDNGKLMEEGSGRISRRYARAGWDDLDREGTWREYNDEGKLTEESQWQDGDLHGSRKHFHHAGALAIEETYRSGKRTKRRCFTPEGTVVLEEEYFADGSRKMGEGAPTDAERDRLCMIR